jgi:hypothetical protein
MKPTREALLITNKTLVDGAITALSGIPNITFAFSPQPITKTMLEISQKSPGGYAIDLDPADGAFLGTLLSLSLCLFFRFVAYLCVAKN